MDTCIFVMYNGGLGGWTNGWMDGWTEKWMYGLITDRYVER